MIPEVLAATTSYCEGMTSSQQNPTEPGTHRQSWQLEGLVRPRHDRIVAGVCSGIGRRYGISATTVRLLFILSLLLPGPQLLVYLILWVLIPDEPWTGFPAVPPASHGSA